MHYNVYKKIEFQSFLLLKTNLDIRHFQSKNEGSGPTASNLYVYSGNDWGEFPPGLIKPDTL